LTNSISQLFDDLISKVNETTELRELVRKWVDPYQGKVLQLETDTETFHVLLFRKGTMELKEGEYPSPDVIYRATNETLMSLFTGQASFRDLMKRWELVIIGAGHESVPLSQLIMRALQAG
jgi:hypothetical protein